MKSLIILGAFVSTSAFAAGNCQAAAQNAADAIGAINEIIAPVGVFLNGPVGKVEHYSDENGYFSITTNTGMGGNTCMVVKVIFHPKYGVENE